MPVKLITLSPSEVSDAIKSYLKKVYDTPVGAEITIPKNLSAMNVTIKTKDEAIAVPDCVVMPKWEEPEFTVDDRVLLVPVTPAGGKICERFGYIMRVRISNGKVIHLQACVSGEVGKLKGKPGTCLEGKKRQEVLHAIPSDTNDPDRSVRIIKVYPFLTTDKINIKEACTILKEHIDVEWI